MTFTFKLSRRLAASWAVTLLLMLDQSSCAEPQIIEGFSLPTDTAVVLVKVTPHVDTTLAGQPVQLHVTGLNESGEPIPVDADWSATGGSVNSTGLFLATAPGDYKVRAKGRNHTQLVDSATVLVFPSPVTLTGLVLGPASTSLNTGGTRQFSVSGQWSDGSTTAPSVTYSATGGTVTSGGLYTAGSTAGTFRVIATQQGGTLADTAQVTISVAPPVLQAVVLSPASTSLTTGATRQYSVTGQWSDGSTTAPSVTYSVTGGTITSGGLYTAGNTAGTFRVIATQQGGTLADTAQVTISVLPPILQAVVLSPASTSLTTGATRQFSVSGQWSDGSTTAPSVTYSATGGTITSGGLYTAGGTAGTFRVVATQQGGTLADTAQVTISVAPPVLQAVVLSPASTSLTTGATRQFSVSGQWSDGSTTAPSVTYSATGGTITSGGLYTAGGTAGTFRVIATQQGGALADTAQVTVTAPAPVLQKVILAPTSASLTAGATRQFSVTGQWSDGSTSAPSVTYSATGGTITSGGLYTAGSTAGGFGVIATQQGGTLADTAQVTISVLPPVLQAVVLSPASTSLNTGATRQFSVTGQWSDGSTTAPAVTYSATGGTITSSGLYTAGSTAGGFRVIATQQGGTLADTAQVTVTTSGSFPAPDIYSWSFENGTAGTLDPFNQAADIYSNDAAVVGQTHSAGKSFPSGSGATSYGWLLYPAAKYDEVWVRFAMWQQGTYQGSGATGQKIMRLYASVNGNDAYVASFGEDGGGSWLWDFGAYDDPNRSTNRHPTLPAPGKNNGWNFGEWHWLEWHYVGHVGQKATIEIYYDGEATPRYTATSDFTVSAQVGRYFEIYSTINGPFDGPLSYKFDDIAYSTQRIGLPAGAKIGTP